MTPSKSETGSDYPTPTPGTDAYAHYPLPNHDSPYGSTVNLPLDNPSSDHLIGNQPERSDTYRGKRQQSGSRRYPGPPGDSISAAPLLDSYPSHPGYDDDAQATVPYPPSAYTQPPIGYTPPTLRRTGTSSSMGSDGGFRADTKWDAGNGDLGAGSYGAGSATGLRQGSEEAAPQYAQYGGYSQSQIQDGGSSRSQTQLQNRNQNQNQSSNLDRYHDPRDYPPPPPSTGSESAQGRRW